MNSSFVWHFFILVLPLCDECYHACAAMFWFICVLVHLCPCVSRDRVFCQLFGPYSDLVPGWLSMDSIPILMFFVLLGLFILFLKD